MTDQNQPLFISMAQYAQRMGVSEGLVRKQVAAGQVRHIKRGRRTLIPHDEPERHYQEALDSLKIGGAV
ncbi:hypothetical protein RUE5091_00139 [Ruegeria denitrificans]|uniref:DNA binding domain, excisionase family n=1 Tax=Ruegeria denitrificans TaxID=1715692 RepID=A0A0P1I0W7_9RHOB|nr:hypothetical protein [Ruegeria denitrificans]CUJ83711.1 hypothetical protein RUE5091_00139 [Ruegeria denitrificans]